MLLIPRVILASASPRRAEILAAAGIPFVARPTHVPEVRQPGEPGLDYVRRLARDKALAAHAEPGEIVLAADTTVCIDGQILEKPADRQDARRMVALLAGREHEVLTGICLRRDATIVLDHARTAVWFLPMTDAEIDAYVESGEPLDKAGGYGIQGLASKHVHRIEGCYFNVVGLPISLVWSHLRAFL